MKNYDKIDLVSKKADIIYKKMIILLAAVGGSGSYAIRQEGIIQMDSALLFLISIVASVIIGYFAHKHHWKIVDFF